jgi:hypothetical protein
MFLLLFLGLLGAAPLLAVEGHWYGEAEAALSAAAKARKPVLAVAMDHG